MTELVTRQELRETPDNQTPRLTVRLGIIMAGAVALLGTMVALF